MTKLSPEWVQTSDPVIRSSARNRWTTAPACIVHMETSASISLVVVQYFRWEGRKAQIQ